MIWRRYTRKGQADDELREELESYVELTAEEYVARGMGADEARLAARRKLGNLTRIQEDVYDMNTAIFVDSTVRELRQSARMLRRNPAFSITAILTLALGIGATTAIFSIVNGVLIKPLAYPDAEALVTVGHSATFGPQRTNYFPFSPQWFASYAENNRTFQEFGLWRNGQAAITGLGTPEQANTLLVTRGVLAALGVQPALGRWFSRADDQPGTPETVILSSGYWQRRFGGDPAVIGRVLTIDARPRSVIGVMPPRFSFQGFFFQGQAADLILPLRFDLAQPPPDFGYYALARLKPGITLAQANADVARMLPIFKDKYAGTRMDALHLAPAVRPLKEDVVGIVGTVLWVLLGSISIVLLIACANVANLLLVRTESRGQDLGIRAALGAGRGRIAGALMVESLTLSLAGALIGVGLAYGGLQVLLAHGPANLPRLNEITIDLNVLSFAVATAVVSGLLFGLVPIVRLAGPQLSQNLPDFVRSGGRWASAGRSQHRSQNTLVVVQVALALVLLVSSGLMIRTFQNIRKVEPGFTDPSTIQTLRISIAEEQVAEPERVTRMQADILQRLAAIPGVTSVAYATQLPMEPFAMSVIVFAEGKDFGNGSLPPARTIKLVSPGLLRTLGTPLVAGRDLTWEELYEQRNVAVVSATLAREEWNSITGAIGKRIRVGTIGPWQEVVGVAADVYDDGPDKKAPAIVYWPAREQLIITGASVPRSVGYAIRSARTGTESFLREVQQAVLMVNPDLPLSQVRSLHEVYDESMQRTSFVLVMLGIAGVMALALGILGIYGVLAYAVMQRRREVGIRLALGAQPGRVKGMFVYRGLILSAAGIAIGVAVAAGVTRLMASLLFGVTPVDATTFATAAGVLVVAAMAASYIPAGRAAAVDPVETLRAD